MADTPQTPDSPHVANLKFRLKDLQDKSARLSSQKSEPGHDVKAARDRNDIQIAQLEAELKKAK